MPADAEMLGLVGALATSLALGLLMWSVVLLLRSRKWRDD